MKVYIYIYFCLDYCMFFDVRGYQKLPNWGTKIQIDLFQKNKGDGQRYNWGHIAVLLLKYHSSLVHDIY